MAGIFTPVMLCFKPEITNKKGLSGNQAFLYMPSIKFRSWRKELQGKKVWSRALCFSWTDAACQMWTPVTRTLPCHCPSLYPESYQRDRILSEGQLWVKAQGKHEARWWGRMEDSNIIWNLYYSSKSNNHIFRLLLKGPLVKMGVVLRLLEAVWYSI